MTRVLVCGGRYFGVNPDERRHLIEVLDQVHTERNVTLLIHGDASGADRLAGEWAQERSIPIRPFPADWKTHRGAAGPIRNKQMLVEGMPDLVIAFPGGRGTANMVGQARSVGVQVQEIGSA